MFVLSKCYMRNSLCISSGYFRRDMNSKFNLCSVFILVIYTISCHINWFSSEVYWYLKYGILSDWPDNYESRIQSKICRDLETNVVTHQIAHYSTDLNLRPKATINLTKLYKLHHCSICLDVHVLETVHLFPNKSLPPQWKPPNQATNRHYRWSSLIPSDWIWYLVNIYVNDILVQWHCERCEVSHLICS